MSGVFTVYRYYDKRWECLYVGMTQNYRARESSHKCRHSWFSEVKKTITKHFQTRGQAVDAEEMAIKAEQPMHNILLKRSHTSWRETQQLLARQKRAEKKAIRQENSARRKAREQSFPIKAAKKQNL